MNKSTAENCLRNFYSFDWQSATGTAATTEDDDQPMIGHLIFPSESHTTLSVEGDMLVFRNDLNIPCRQRKEVILTAASDPKTLIGWQVLFLSMGLILLPLLILRIHHHHPRYYRPIITTNIATIIVIITFIITIIIIMIIFIIINFVVNFISSRVIHH